MAREEKPKQRIAAGAAMMVGHGTAGPPKDAAELSRRMASAYERALAQGLSDQERSKAIDDAILKFQAGEPE